MLIAFGALGAPDDDGVTGLPYSEAAASLDVMQLLAIGGDLANRPGAGDLGHRDWRGCGREASPRYAVSFTRRTSAETCPSVGRLCGTTRGTDIAGEGSDRPSMAWASQEALFREAIRVADKGPLRAIGDHLTGNAARSRTFSSPDLPLVG
jgi:hypothetical protein